MFGRMKEKMTVMAAKMWSHRMLYTGLAGAYGAGCLGLDKEIVQQVVAGIYCALVVKG